VSKLISLEDAAALVPDGARIAFGGGGAVYRRPMAFSRALVRRDARDLHVIQFLASLETDLLIGAGAVASTNATYLGFLEHGPAPNFSRIVPTGRLRVNEYSEYMFTASLRAADMGIPFIPWKTPWKSDLVEQLGFATVSDPYGHTELLAVPAMAVDVAVIHAGRVDEDGYVTAPAEPDLIWDYDYLIARAAKTTIVCAEEIGPPSDPARVALIGAEVNHVVHAPGGAWPCGMHSYYEPDAEHLHKTYVPAASAGGEEFAGYLREHAMTEPGSVNA
jgi:glutaconate CoA-transferase, subunit A